EGPGILLEQISALAHPVGGDHSAGEFFEALLKHALPTIMVDDALIVGQSIQRRRQRPLRDALGCCVALEGFEPGFKTAAGLAGYRREYGSRPDEGERKTRASTPLEQGLHPVVRCMARDDEG